MSTNKQTLALAIMITTSLAGAAAATTINAPVSPCANASSATRTFTVVAGLSGYNGSRYRQESWPVMQVERCDLVVINIDNKDFQSHGLAVEFYAVNGIVAPGGQRLNISFLATKLGEFRVLCDVVCTVHNYMQHGLLIVT